ncbi:hypothetical protein ACFQ4M_19745 [Thauera mechernichensis]|uniref:Uncharacterized protein n=1 Tax=Thauera mechernichensis TaxID=82788 RepID=A0ABW3WIC4_9RHOO|nr:hypothetical protein [Thauera mechernichensis]MDG3066867.1 hypothetical protein [Thauera mechernichensis]
MRRFTFTREFYTPKEYTEIHRKDEVGAAVYASADGLVVLAFAGKRQKPDFHIRFAKKERAEQYVSDWLARLQVRAQEKTERREARKAAPNPLQVGDILRCMWGYEQTNIDYYEVTALIGKHTVEIREVARMSEETLSMQGVCVPKPGAYIGEPMRKRADADGSVKINSFSWARKVEAKTVAGVKLFAPDSWTAYA